MGTYLVCWLDLIGQKGKIRKDFKQAVKTLFKFRNKILHIENCHKQTNKGLSCYNGTINLNFQYIADSVLVSIPIKTEDWGLTSDSLLSINFMFKALSELMLSSINNDYLFRGAVEIGKCLDISFRNNSEIYGQAVVNAYENETEKVRYPRIVVGESVVDYLNNINLNNFDDDEKKSIENYIDEIKKMIEKDKDNFLIINYLSDFLLHLKIIDEEMINSALLKLYDILDYPSNSEYRDRYQSIIDYFGRHGYKN